MKKIWVFGNYILLFFALIIFNCTRWVIANFSFESFDEIIFTITSPLEGTGNGMIWGFIKENLTWPFIIVLLIYLFRCQHLCGNGELIIGIIRQLIEPDFLCFFR